ncbi:MAG: ATP-binding protein, partial [bacterium]
MKHAQIYARLLAVLLCLTLLAVAPARGETPVIRVGYYENEVFQEGARDGAVKQGYAYEYYRKLSEYTGWKYAYIYDNFSDLYRMLLDGEIDMLAGLAMTDERIGKIGYPKAPMGHETYCLVKHDTDDDITVDPATFQGRRIGVLDSAVVDVLNRYLAEQRVRAQVIPYPDYAALFEAFDRHDVDLLAAESDGAYGRDHADVLLPFGASDYYLCVDVNRPDLLEALNRAQTQLAAEEPNYVNSLSLKYYPVTLSSRAFSAMEKDWLAEHDTLRVGYFDDYLPYSGTDKNGNVTGLLRDLLPAMLESLGINTLKVSYQGYADYADMVADMGRGSIDLAFPVGGGLYYAEQNDMYQTNPVVSSYTEVVYTGTYAAIDKPRIAVNTRNRMQYYFVKSNFPDAEIVYYSTIEACLDAVRRGTVNYTTLNGLRAGDLMKNRRFRNLSLYPLPRNDDRCFGVSIGNAGLLKLINRGINVVGMEYAQNQTYKYTDNLYSYSFLDIIFDHMALFGTVMLALAVLAIFLLTREAGHNRARMRENEEIQHALEEKNHELALSRADLQETDEIVADAGFGIWHILLEDGHSPRMRANAKMMELLGEEGRLPTEEELYEVWHSRIIPADLTAVEKNVGEMLRGRLAETTYRWSHPKRGIIYVRCGGVMKASAGSRRLLRGYHSDVTDIVNEDMARKEALSNALKAAERANQAKTEFLSNMSHDIRTPMNAIVGFSALAASQLDHPEQVKDCLDKISVSSKHLLLLINDVLDMSRIESGQLSLEMSGVHLPDLIRELRTISVIHDDVASKQQELSIDIVDVHHEDIVTDRLRLNQVLLNLLSNAIKFTPAGGVISFRVTEMPCARDGWVNFEFRVKDNGVGMSEAFQRTLFDAFAREQNAAITNVQGTGLGLAITKRIVDMMG